MAGGRPRIISSPQEFDERVDSFLVQCQVDGDPITLTGLILSLGLSSRESLDEYGRRPEFSDSVKYAKLLIENGYEKKLHEQSCTGPIFALKNFGWKDKQEVDQTVNGNMKHSVEWTVQPVKPVNEV